MARLYHLAVVRVWLAQCQLDMAAASPVLKPSGPGLVVVPWLSIRKSFVTIDPNHVCLLHKAFRNGPSPMQSTGI